MMDKWEPLLARIRQWTSADVREADEIVRALEAAIVHDDTDFDDAAALSRVLEDFLKRRTEPTISAEISDFLQNPELIEKFALEALETLSLVEASLLTMEETGTTGDFLNAAFRSIHTLKGNAGFFGFSDMEAHCMEMESLLDSLRKGDRRVDDEVVESLLTAHDHLRGLVQKRIASPTKEPDPRNEIKKREIRVDTEKLQALFDLVGELITAEAMVLDHHELKGLSFEKFPQAAANLSKITRELQSVSTSLRMIPLDGLFNKMKRLVRDLGRKFSKDLELEVRGGETEMDRHIIEEISDPLVHIIRNAVDHGIESQEIRRERKKPSVGTISLSAKYEGNEIWITVSDDGGGLDGPRILNSAREKGLLKGVDPQGSALWELIFEPGFSTAAEVSEISGRGVGMDVVKKNLERLRGVITINTEAGIGTQFTLKVPLTLALIDGVTLRSGTTLYSIPIADVAEFQNYHPDQITRTGRTGRVLALRDEIIPVLPLAEVFPTATRPVSEKQISVVVRSQNRKAALVVDEVVGYRQIVLKPLPTNMEAPEGISGCTVLGNGEVSLVVDVAVVLKKHLA